MPCTILDRVQSPADVRALTRDELRQLADDIRARLIDVCSRTGGHIGAGLGVVELTIALHYAFDTPRDQLVWDVGHQGYPHKLLTGRNAGMETLRQENGVSGFLKRSESEYDAFGAGHAATSISAAVGIAAGRDVKGEDFKVVAILGDGALTSGLAYEGLNNAGHSDRDVVVVLNDNEMSIAPNVGAMSKYLNSIQRNSLYNRVRSAVGEFVDNAPGPLSVDGRARAQVGGERQRRSSRPACLFEELGFRYFGPIDGHDIDGLVETFAAVRDDEGSAPRARHHAEGQGISRRRDQRREVACASAWPRSGDGQAAQASRRRMRVHEGVRRGPRRAWATKFRELVVDHGGDAERHGHRRIRQGASGAVLRRRHRRGARGDVRRRHGDARRSARRRDLLDVPAARLRQHHPRRGDPVAAGDLLHGSRGPRRRGRRDAHGPVRHRVHARRART